MPASVADTRIVVALAVVALAVPTTMIGVVPTVKHLCALGNAVAQAVVG